MNKTAYKFALTIALIAILVFSCGGGGGGVDNAVEDTSFSIGYNSNGAESGTVPAVQKGNGKEVLSVSANIGNLAKGGYLFDCWNTAADGSGANYAPGALYNGKNITLYAKWAKIFNYNVIDSGSPAPSLDGQQRSPGLSSAIITGLTDRGRQLSSVTIPESIDGYPVSSIGDNAFQGCSNLTDVSIPQTVTEIGDNAFDGCSNLTGVTMQGTEPPALGSDVFSGCVLLTVSVPQSAASAYNSNPSWTTITIISPGTFCITYSGNGADGGIVPLRQIGMTGFSIQVYGNTGDLTRAGCSFNNWNTKADGTGNRFEANAPYPGPDNITLYAQWAHPDYTVIFDGQGANTQASPATIKVVAPANTIGSLPATPPKKDGYYFAGWYTQPEGAGTPFVVGSQVISDKTVYAYWTLRPDFTVTYDSQGATTPAGHTTKVVVAPKTTVEELPTPPAKTGYNFGGWYTSQAGAGSQFTEETIVNENITVYAKWNSYSYIVTFDSQGATTAAVPSYKTVATPATTIDNLPTVPEKDDYYFGGWFTQPNGNGSIFDANTPVTDNITIYAKWTLVKTYTVNFNSQGAETPANPSSKTVVTPATKIDALPSDPIRIGHSFAGWFTGIGGSGTRFTADTTVNSNKTVYACWIADSYQITYKDKGGTAFSGIHGNYYPKSHTYGVKTTLVNPSKEGYLFGGWYNNSSCTGDALTQIASDAITENITLYAKWDSYNYTVTFDGQGATTAANPTSKSVLSPATKIDALPSNPARPGFIFGGWYTETGGGGSQFTASTVVTSDRTVYAKWTAIFSYEISDGNIAITGLTNEGKKLSEIIIPDKIDGKDVTSIKYKAFYSCAGLTSVTISNSVTSIGMQAFEGCTGLTGITIPNGVTTIGQSAFQGCTSFISINIPDSVTSIGALAFKGCIGLTGITIPNGVTTIGQSAFQECVLFTSINIPDSVTSIGAGAFSNCTSLSRITVSGGNSNYCSIDDILYNKTQTEIICVPAQKTGTITIPNTVTTIPGSTFAGCSRLTSVIIPNSVITIGSYAFSGCTGLTSITLPNSITTINMAAFKDCISLTSVELPNSITGVAAWIFRGCTGLTDITLPNSVTVIGANAFLDCTELTSITIPSSVTTMQDYTFCGCTKLASIKVENTTPPTFISHEGVFDRCVSLIKIYVPSSVVNKYKSAEFWSDYANIIIGY